MNVKFSANCFGIVAKMNTALFIGFLVVAVIALATADDPMKQATLLIMNNCKSKVGASDADMKTLQDHKMPTTHEGLCMLECLLTRGNMMKDGKFYKQGFITASTPGMKGNAENIQKLKDMADACEKEVNDTDKCATAKNIVHCTSEKGKAFGFKFPSRL